MATFIRLKQIESGSALQTAASTGTDFSASVQQAVSQSLQTELSQSIINVIVNNVSAVLPSGVISSSAQINISETTGSLTGSRVVGGTQASSVEYDNILNKPTIVSGSEQVISILSSLNTFTASLDNTFATDAELAYTSSQIVDQGEW
jgi:hypothetical protein